MYVCVCICMYIHTTNSKSRYIYIHICIQARTIAEGCEESCDRTIQGVVCGGLADCFMSQGQYDKANKLLEEARCHARTMVADEGSRTCECNILGSLGRCKLALGEYENAITCFNEQWSIARKLDLSEQQARAAQDLGVASLAQARVANRLAGAASDTPDASSRAVALLGDGLHWLQTAYELAQSHGLVEVKIDTLLHLSFLYFDMGEEETAQDYLKQHLRAEVDIGRTWCRGCGQKRGGEEATMLTCGGCGVARFCDENHQRTASSKDGALRKAVRHKDICPLLKKWRQVVKGKATAASCTPDLLAFLSGDVWWRCAFSGSLASKQWELSSE